METNSKNLSFEFYPPKTDLGNEKLISVAKELALFKPEYFSVTFGAGGSTQEGTFNACLALQNKTSVEPCAHISGVTSDKEQIKSILDSYKKAGFKKPAFFYLLRKSGFLIGSLNIATPLQFIIFKVLKLL